MLILSTALIVGFGGLTIWLQDERFIQIKPTAIYLLFGVLLIGGWMRGKALLQILLEAAFEGLDREGWLKLSRNWGLFFTFTQLPMLMKHGLALEDRDEVVKDEPPTA